MSAARARRRSGSQLPVLLALACERRLLGIAGGARWRLVLFRCPGAYRSRPPRTAQTCEPVARRILVYPRRPGETARNTVADLNPCPTCGRHRMAVVVAR